MQSGLGILPDCLHKFRLFPAREPNLLYNKLMQRKVDPDEITTILSLILHYRSIAKDPSLSDFENFLASIPFSYSWEDTKWEA